MSEVILDNADMLDQINSLEEDNQTSIHNDNMVIPDI